MTQPTPPLSPSSPESTPESPQRHPADYVYPAATILLALLLLFSAAF